MGVSGVLGEDLDIDSDFRLPADGLRGIAEVAHQAYQDLLPGRKALGSLEPLEERQKTRSWGRAVATLMGGD